MCPKRPVFNKSPRITSEKETELTHVDRVKSRSGDSEAEPKSISSEPKLESYRQPKGDYKPDWNLRYICTASLGFRQQCFH
jgi:hypothetical protein